MERPLDSLNKQQKAQKKSKNGRGRGRSNKILINSYYFRLILIETKKTQRHRLKEWMPEWTEKGSKNWFPKKKVKKKKEDRVKKRKEKKRKKRKKQSNVEIVWDSERKKNRRWNRVILIDSGLIRINLRFLFVYFLLISTRDKQKRWMCSESSMFLRWVEPFSSFHFHVCRHNLHKTNQVHRFDARRRRRAGRGENKNDMKKVRSKKRPKAMIEGNLRTRTKDQLVNIDRNVDNDDDDKRERGRKKSTKWKWMCRLIVRENVCTNQLLLRLMMMTILGWKQTDDTRRPVSVSSSDLVALTVWMAMPLCRSPLLAAAIHHWLDVWRFSALWARFRSFGLGSSRATTMMSANVLLLRPFSLLLSFVLCD